MPFDVLLPQWGMGMNDGKILKWLKNEGDAVAEGEPLVEIESSKVNGEVEAGAAGTLGRILVPEGEVVPTGTRLGVILATGEGEADLPPRPARRTTDSAAVAPSSAPASTSVSEAPAPPSPPAGRRQITPVARKLAKELGVDVDTVRGSGPNGRVLEEDVRRAAATTAARHSEASSQEVANVVKLTGLRGAVARRMSESAAIPAVTLNAEVDITETLRFMEGLIREWRPHRMRPQFQDLVLKATARALREHPRANAHLVSGEVREMAHVNLGFALSVPDGLLVPVIRDADEKPLVQLAKEVREVSLRVKAGRQTVEDLSWGTFTVTSLGSFGVDFFNALINPPQVGILAVGRTNRKPAVVNGEIAIRSTVWLGITFDHRAWDGAPAGDFLRAVANHVSDPSWMAA